MNILTDKQHEYRAYLETPLWQEIRQKALAYHGSICSRCEEYGNDVHHKTYKRAGGDERMDDLEILCRDCHDAEHRIEKALYKNRRTGKRDKSMNVKGVLGYLTFAQKESIRLVYDSTPEILLFDFSDKANRARDYAMEMLRLDSIHGIPKGHNSSRKFFTQKIGQKPFDPRYEKFNKKKKK